ncbi:AcrR family transcriptional regulator [Silvibacterium bohemicum]|uniref:AcrR family transcriptional regulator n=1 Tax=Silvibacterium bohemicum TaxID=1577686 RepID=A0A841JY03_9BACT|nr:TetR/AcrR family transcriptional regulator [Silvibacterium bohemicum]MBB6146216.1 AcrR family transcriptional regulator [Silvibacterium bohemicum]
MTDQQKKQPASKKAEETRTRILEASLQVFRERGFERATMRDIAAEAGVALGAAYYYFESKDAIVMAFYERSQGEMKTAVEETLARSRTLETRLRGIIQVKFDCFEPNRKLLGALSAHADPEHPLSPFSRDTAAIRDQDISFFARAAEESKVKLPPNIAPYLPRLLWLYQMGLILFWVYDHSAEQRRTKILFEKTLKMLLLTLRLAEIPLLRPLHRLAGDLLKTVYGDTP